MKSWKSYPLIKYVFKPKGDEASNYHSYSLYSTHPEPCFGCPISKSCPDAVFIKDGSRMSERCIPALKAEIEWLEERSTLRMLQVHQIRELSRKRR